jgi:hypothetical protein
MDFNNLTIALPVHRVKSGPKRMSRRQILAAQGKGVNPLDEVGVPPAPDAEVPAAAAAAATATTTQPPPEPAPVDASIKSEDPITAQVDRAVVPQDAQHDITTATAAAGAAAGDQQTIDDASAEQYTPEQLEKLDHDRQILYQGIIHRMQPDMTNIPVEFIGRLFGSRSNIIPHLELIDKLTHRFRLVPHQIRHDSWGEPVIDGPATIKREYQRRMLWAHWYNQIKDKLNEIRKSDFRTQPNTDGQGVPDLSRGYADPVPEYLDDGGQLEQKLNQIISNPNINKIPHTTRRALKDLYASLEFYQKMRKRFAAIEKGIKTDPKLTKSQIAERLKANYIRASNPKLSEQEREAAVLDSYELAPPRSNIAMHVKGKSRKHDTFHAMVPMNNRAANIRGGPSSSNAGHDAMELLKVKDGFERMVEKKLLTMSEKLEKAVEDKTKVVVDAMDEKGAALKQGKALRLLSRWPVVIDRIEQTGRTKDFDKSLKTLKDFHNEYSKIDSETRSAMMPLIKARLEQDLARAGNHMMSIMQKEREENIKELQAVTYAKEELKKIDQLLKDDELSSEDAHQRIGWTLQAIETTVGRDTSSAIGRAMATEDFHTMQKNLNQLGDSLEKENSEMKERQHEFITMVAAIEDDITGTLPSFDQHRAIFSILDRQRIDEGVANIAGSRMEPVYYAPRAEKRTEPVPFISPPPLPQPPMQTPYPFPQPMNDPTPPTVEMVTRQPTPPTVEMVTREPTPPPPPQIISSHDEIMMPHVGRSTLEQTWDHVVNSDPINETMDHYEKVLGENHANDFHQRLLAQKMVEAHPLSYTPATNVYHEPVQVVPVAIERVRVPPQYMPPAYTMPPSQEGNNFNERLDRLNDSLSSRLRKKNAMPYTKPKRVPGSAFTPVRAITTRVPNRIPTELLEPVAQANNSEVVAAVQTLNASAITASRVAAAPPPERPERLIVSPTSMEVARITSPSDPKILFKKRDRSPLDPNSPPPVKSPDDYYDDAPESPLGKRAFVPGKTRPEGEPESKSPKPLSFDEATEVYGLGLDIRHSQNYAPIVNANYLVHNVPLEHMQKGGGFESLHKLWMNNINPLVRGNPTIFLRLVHHNGGGGGQVGAIPDPITGYATKSSGGGCNCRHKHRHGGGGKIDWEKTHTLSHREVHDQWGASIVHPNFRPKDKIITTLCLYIYHFPDEFIHPDEMLLLAGYKNYHGEMPFPKIFESIWFNYILVIMEMADRIRNTRHFQDVLPSLKQGDPKQFSTSVQIPDLVDASEWPVSSFAAWPETSNDGDLEEQIKSIMSSTDTDATPINTEILEKILLGEAMPLINLEARDALGLAMIAHHLQMKYIPVYA